MTNDNIRRINGQQRVHERLPGDALRAALHGQPLHVANWSLGGLGVIQPAEGNRWEARQKLALRLDIPTTTLEISYPVTMRVAHIADDSNYTGLQFVELSPNTAGALHYVQQCQQHGQEVDAVALQDAAAKTLIERNQPWKPQPTRIRWGRYIGVGLGLLVILTLGMLSAHGLLFRIPTNYAAITAEAHTLTAPEAGRVILLQGAKRQLSTPDTSSKVLSAGEPLLRIENMQLLAEEKSLKVQQEFQQQRLAILQKQLKLVKGTAYYQRRAAKNTSNQQYAAIKAATAVKNERWNAYQRLKELSPKGYVSRANLQDAKEAFSAADANLAAARSALAASKDREKVASENNTQDNPRQISRDLEYTKAELDYLTKQRTILQDQIAGLEIVSPCNCRLVNAYISNSTWVQQSAPLLLLQGGEPRIEAKLPWAELAKVSIGGKADVRFADGLSVTGSIERIDRSTNGQHRYGLPDQLQDDAEQALVEVSIREAIFNNGRYRAGMPVEVILHTQGPRWWRTIGQQIDGLVSWLGLPKILQTIKRGAKETWLKPFITPNQSTE